MRAAIYARYSTDLQSEASIEDQLRLCHRLASQNGWSVIQTFSDAGISGSSLLRPGYQQLLADARLRRFDVVIAEGIDRISRDQEHIAAFYKQISFNGISIVTVAEGEISDLHIGLKGTMSSLFLKDLAQKTRRGLEGRVRKGKSAGGLTYGYSILRGLRPDGTPVTGERGINEPEADVVRRIFRDYSHGLSPRAIAAALNAEGISGPRGAWGSSTIYGNHERGTGILNNELYVGRLVWNRQRFLKDPMSGKRVARMNAEADWVIEDVPALRIVEDDLWAAVKARQGLTRNDAIRDGIRHVGRTKRPVHLFSGKLVCGCCGGGVILLGKTYYGCSAVRNKGTCSNRSTIRRDALEDRVLSGLRDQLLHPDLIAEFVRASQEEFNRLSADRQKDHGRIVQGIAKVERQIDQIIMAITDGMYHPSMKGKMTDLETSKAALEVERDQLPQEQHVLLHPGLSESYRQKVALLIDALNDVSAQAEAATLIRSLLTEIRLVPVEGRVMLELVGELAGLLALGATNAKSRAGGAAVLHGSTVMVAGTGFEPVTFRL